MKGPAPRLTERGEAVRDVARYVTGCTAVVLLAAVMAWAGWLEGTAL